MYKTAQNQNAGPGPTSSQPGPEQSGSGKSQQGGNDEVTDVDFEEVK
jgi:hypothetical protein